MFAWIGHDDFDEDAEEGDLVEPSEGEYGMVLYDLWRERPVEVSPDAFDAPLLSDQMDRLSLVLNGRPATPAEMAGWKLQRAQGVSLAALADALLPDSENVSWSPCCNEEFVEDLYYSALNREMDAGAQYWVDQLGAGASPGTVAAAISESAEHVVVSGTVGPVPAGSSSIYRLYQAFFARVPDASGLDYWRLQAARGAGLDGIASAFAASPEFVSQAGALSNDEFISFCYEHVLGRATDAEGAEYWATLMNQGLSRGGVMLGFSESAEYILTTDTLPE